MNDFDFKPKAGGLDRLRMTLNAYERQEWVERKFLVGAVGVLILALVCAIPWPAKSFKFPEEVKSAVQVEGARIYQVPVSNDGVRLYWILH